jgi:hypothetical protein
MFRRVFGASVLALALLSGSGGATASAASGAAAATVKIVHYANCAAMNRVYPHGDGQRGARDRSAARCARSPTST